MEITARDRKLLFVLLGVAVVALLLFVFVLHKGGSNNASPTTLPPIQVCRSSWVGQCPPSTRCPRWYHIGRNWAALSSQ